MSEQQNRKVVQQAYDNFKSGDIESLVGLMSDDIKWQLPEVENIPFTGRRSGRESVIQFFASVGDNQEALQFEPNEFIEQGDKVVALGHYRWRVLATGREYESDFVHVFTVRDGQIIAFNEYLDTAAATLAYQKAASA
ncbi:MAG: nuclear transport factor 2 family protein [Blastocatellia bacterium]